jgi:hypothetical protein
MTAAPSTPEPSGLADAVLRRHPAGPHKVLACEWAGYADEDACPDRRAALAAPSTPEPSGHRAETIDGVPTGWCECGSPYPHVVLAAPSTPEPSDAPEP